jgi:hypothetical protein
MPRLFNIDKFEFVHGPFKLPDNIYVFRADHPDHPVPPDYPTFFGDYEVAAFYASQDPVRVLKAYTLKQFTNVLDIRYIQAILPFLWDSVTKTPREVEIMKMTSLVLGLSSFSRQIELLHEFSSKSVNLSALLPFISRMEEFRDLPMKPSWVNPIEPKGVRCGITDIDYYVMGFLKQLFGGLVDGIIAPALYSPFHNTKDPDIRKSMMYQEIIFFNPSAVLKEVVVPDGSNVLSVETPDVSMEEYVAQRLRVLTPVTSATQISMIAGGRGRRRSKRRVGGVDQIALPPDAYGELIGSGDEEAKKRYISFVKTSTTLADKMIETQIFMKYYCPNACEGVTPILRGEPRSRTIKIGNIHNS